MTELYYECTCGFIGHIDHEENYLRHKDENGLEMTVCLPREPMSWQQSWFGSHIITIVTKEQLKLEGR